MAKEKTVVAVVIATAIWFWWGRDALRQSLAKPDSAPMRVYTWVEREAKNVHFSDRPGPPDAKTVTVDPSRITPLAPLPPAKAAPGPQPAAAGAENSLQQLGRDMQEAQMRVREARMQQVIDGDSRPAR